MVDETRAGLEVWLDLLAKVGEAHGDYTEASRLARKVDNSGEVFPVGEVTSPAQYRVKDVAKATPPLDLCLPPLLELRCPLLPASVQGRHLTHVVMGVDEVPVSILGTG